MQTIIYLIRHAAYENPRQLYHGWLAGFHLSRDGKLQAQSLALKLKAKPLVAVYASHLARSTETAKIIAKLHHLPIIIDDRIIDIRSPLQGKTIAYMETVNWNQYRPEFTRAGGERLSEVYKRMNDFLKEKLTEHRGQQFAAVSHGDPIMSVKVKLAGGRLSLKEVREDYVAVGSGLVLTFGGRNCLLKMGKLTG